MTKKIIPLLTVISCLAIIFGCASKKKNPETLKSEEIQDLKTIMDVTPPEWKETGDADFDELIGDLFEQHVKSQSKAVDEIYTTLITSTDYNSFSKSVAYKANKENISTDEASSIILNELKTASDSGDENATKRLQNIQKVLKSVEKDVDQGLEGLVKLGVTVAKKLAAFESLKYKIEEGNFLEKAKLAKAFASGLKQLGEFTSYSKKSTKFLKYVKKQLSHPAWQA